MNIFAAIAFRNSGTPSVAAPGSLAVAWVLPTQMADGSPIGTITAQTIYYDTTSRMGTPVAYANSTSVGSGSATTKTITGLVVGQTYYYALTTTVGGVESDYGIESLGVAS